VEESERKDLEFLSESEGEEYRRESRSGIITLQTTLVHVKNT
jgi:hypothetical protein